MKGRDCCISLKIVGIPFVFLGLCGNSWRVGHFNWQKIWKQKGKRERNSWLNNYLIGWSVCFFGWSVGWLAGGRLTVGWLVGHQLVCNRSVDRVFRWSVGWLIVWLFVRLDGWFVGCLFDRLFGRSVDCVIRLEYCGVLTLKQVNWHRRELASVSVTPSCHSVIT